MQNAPAVVGPENDSKFWPHTYEIVDFISLKRCMCIIMMFYLLAAIFFKHTHALSLKLLAGYWISPVVERWSKRF